MSDALGARGPRSHVVSELGLELRLEDDELHGSAEVLTQMHVPGTQCLRTSILAVWIDVLAGVLGVDGFGGAVPVTVDLAVDLTRPAVATHRVDAVARMVKAGRTMAIAEVELRADGQRDCLALGSASFVAAPDRSLTMPSRADNVAALSHRTAFLTEPLAERAGCIRRSAGVASLARRDDNVNASDTINGGLIALVAEEAVLSRSPGTTLSSLALRYLRPARLGPIVGVATSFGAFTRVEIRDEGADGRLAVLATARSFPAPS